MEITFKRTDAAHPDFLHLVAALDEDMRSLYKSYQQSFAAINQLDESVKVLLAYEGNEPVGCGAIRNLNEPRGMELKRMYVIPTRRGRGISKQILKGLEAWAKEAGAGFIRLETGKKQPVAIALYLQSGYVNTEAFGAYAHIEGAICMKKELENLEASK